MSRLSGKWLAVDSETTSLNFKTGKLRSIQTFDGRKCQVLEKKSDWLKLKSVLEDKTVVKLIHNTQFDIPYIYEHTGILIRNIWDSKVMESIILGVGSMGENAKLKNVPGFVDKYSTKLDITLKRRKIAILNKEVRDSFINQEGKLTPEQIKYAKEDVLFLKKLMDQQLADLQRLNLMELADLENRATEVTAQMVINGIGFDTKQWLAIEAKHKKLYEDGLEHLPAHVKWSSPAQIKKFFARKGIRIDSLEDLDSIAKQHNDPYLNKLVEIRRFGSYVSKYGSNWLTREVTKNVFEPTVDPDGRVRCSFEQVLQTGRYSSFKPNLQQLPDLGKSDNRLCFKPAKGSRFCIGDFTGQELGIMAVGGKEQSWIDAMLRGDDVHSIMGRELYTTDWDKAKDNGCIFPKRCKCPKHKPMRRDSKDLNFGMAYGKSANTLAIDLNKTPAEANRLFWKYKGKAPRVTRWLNQNGDYAVKFKETFTLPPYNRRRSLELEPEEWRRRNQGKNTPVQGTGSDILKLSLVYLFDYIRDNKLQDLVKIVLIIHDEIICEVKTPYVKKWKPIMKQLMDQAAFDILGYSVVTTEPFDAGCWLKEAAQ